MATLHDCCYAKAVIITATKEDWSFSQQGKKITVVYGGAKEDKSFKPFLPNYILKHSFPVLKKLLLMSLLILEAEWTLSGH